MLKHNIMLGFVLIVSLLVSPENAIAEPAEIVPTPKSIPELVTYYSNKYSVSEVVINKVINCESGFNPNAHNLTSREDSWGLVQINRLAHPHISVEQATNPSFAIEFLAENLSKNNGRIWTCYNKFY